MATTWRNFKNISSIPLFTSLMKSEHVQQIYLLQTSRQGIIRGRKPRLSTESPDYQLGWAVGYPKTQLSFYCGRISCIINPGPQCFQTTQQQTNYSNYFKYCLERVKYTYSCFELGIRGDKTVRPRTFCLFPQSLPCTAGSWYVIRLGIITALEAMSSERCITAFLPEELKYGFFKQLFL